jgi:hypothetical protein
MDVQRLTPAGTPAERPAAPAPAPAPARAFGDVLRSAAAVASGDAAPAPAPACAPAAPFAPGPADLLAGPPPVARPATGDAPFVLVHRHGQEFHVYGTGKDRQVFPAPPPRA